MTAQVGYQWRLRKVMAMRDMFASTDLTTPLAQRGIDLSPSALHRLVTGTPERLNLAVLAALCDILDVTPDELITVTGPQAGPNTPTPVSAVPPRPKRVRLQP